MRTRVVFCDSRNNKLLWKAALEHACRRLDTPKARHLSWWEAALRFVGALFSQ